MDLPTVWGRHEQVLIDPVIVGGRTLVTSIMEPPQEWHQRLQTLGFKRLTKAWLRVGALTEAEYFYISPNIDLIGLRPDDVIDYIPPDAPNPDVPPHSIQDELLALWQRKPGALLTTLTMEQGQSYTRQQAWRVIEATLSGEPVPETETLIGLTLTSLGAKGMVPSDAQSYARRLGWADGEPIPSDAPEPKPLMRPGDTISWFDSDGVQKHGRLAQTVYSTDTHGLVYTHSPRWVGGYPVVAPEYISRSQFYYPDAAPDWLPDDLVNADNIAPIEQDLTAAMTHVVTLTEDQYRALRYINNLGAFPVKGWRDYLAHTYGVSNDDLDALQQVEQSVSALSSHYFGHSLQMLRLYAVDDRLIMGADTVLRGGGRLGSAHRIAASAPADVNDGVISFDLSALASQCDSQLRERVSTLREQAEALGQALDMGGPAFPHGAVRSWREVDSLVRSLDRPLDEDGVYRLFATAGVTGMYSMLGSFGVGQSAELKELSYDIDLTAIRAQNNTDSFISMSSAIESMAAGEGWPATDGAVNYYVLAILKPPAGLLSDPALSRLGFYESGGSAYYSAVFPTASALQSAYAELAGKVIPLASDDQKPSIERALEVAAGFPLRDRFMAAMAKARALPVEVISEHLTHALATATKGAFLQETPKWRNQVITGLIEFTRRQSNVQGVVVFDRKRSMAWRNIDYSDAALSQSRQATMLGAIADIKLKHRITGKPVAIDLVDLVDPELTALLADDQGLVVGNANNQKADGHQDIGVVQGLALKDIRGMTGATLAGYAEQMNDLQKGKYLKKELIFPRTTLQELKDEGVSLNVAASYDMLWKGLPSKPISPAPRHVNAFIDLMVAMREHLQPVIDLHRKPTEKTADQFDRFSEDIYNATSAASEKALDSNVYPYRLRKIRGIGADWAGFQPAFSYRWVRKLQGMEWSDLVKERKKAASSTGSKVQRGEVVRTGDDYRKGGDVDGEDFIKTFMFSGIEYGNWTNQKERGKHLNLAYDSMMDFAKVLGVEPAALSLGGRLGLCIGSRGRGGKRPAMAHFEPTNYAINLTRMRGAGSLAHEFFHAVAAHYGQLASGQVSDVTDSLGYTLMKSGPVPPVAGSPGLRDEVRQSFFNLMVTIMREPDANGDASDLTTYTKRSQMLVAAIDEDGGKEAKYWSEPCEMFARTMEVWLREHLAEQGKRNDYLVDSDIALGGVYPSREHLDRVNERVSAWLDSLRVELKEVNHPYLGDVQIPTLHSYLRSQQPFSERDLEDYARTRLAELFGASAPEIAFTQSHRWAGLYDAAANVIVLNRAHADKGTFYHEAWHACEQVLLTAAEREGMDRLFAPGSAASDQVIIAMREQGWPEHVIARALACEKEMAAYAFQLWTDQKLTLADDGGGQVEFRRSRQFIDGVVEVGDLFELDDAVALFERFRDGSLAERATAGVQMAATQDAPLLYWQLPDDELEDVADEPRLGRTHGLGR